MKRVLIIEQQAKQYRRAFFDQLYKELISQGVCLTVAYGQGSTSEETKSDTLPLPLDYGYPIRNYWFLNHRLLLQCPLKHILQSDLIIVDQANRHLINIFLLTLSLVGLKRIAFWGHGYDRSRQSRSSLSEKWKRITLNWVDYWFAYNAATVRYLKQRKVKASKIIETQNAIDTYQLKQAIANTSYTELHAFLDSMGIPSQAPIAVYCGSLYLEKHLEFLIESSALVRHAIPQFHLMIIGDGPLRNQLEDLAAGYPWVHLLGRQDGQQKILALKASSVFLNPGVTGLAILDALAAGLPYITTDITGHGPEIEYLIEGSNGFIVPALDREYYAHKVISLLKNPSQLAYMRRSAIDSSAELTVENMTQRFATGILAALKVRPL